LHSDLGALISFRIVGDLKIPLARDFENIAGFAICSRSRKYNVGDDVAAMRLITAVFGFEAVFVLSNLACISILRTFGLAISVLVSVSLR